MPMLKSGRKVAVIAPQIAEKLRNGDAYKTTALIVEMRLYYRNPFSIRAPLRPTNSKTAYIPSSYRDSCRDIEYVPSGGGSPAVPFSFCIVKELYAVREVRDADSGDRCVVARTIDSHIVAVFVDQLPQIVNQPLQAILVEMIVVQGAL